MTKLHHEALCGWVDGFELTNGKFVVPFDSRIGINLVFLAKELNSKGVK